jgi:hypothetical protein
MSPAVITCLGDLFAVRSFLAHRASYRRLFCWLRSHGEPLHVGVEGTDTYRTGLIR